MRTISSSPFMVFYTLLLFSSCSSDDIENCPAETGIMQTAINGDIVFDAKRVDFNEPAENTISLGGAAFDNACELMAIVSFIFEKKVGRQKLKKWNPKEALALGTSSFSELDSDTSQGGWDVIDGEPAWIDIEVIEDDRITGSFQATYVVEQNQNDFHSLPDTLRFKNVAFEAEYSEVGD